MKVGEVWKCRKLISENYRAYYFLKEYIGLDNWKALFLLVDEKDNKPTVPHMTEVSGETLYKECTLDEN